MFFIKSKKERELAKYHRLAIKYCNKFNKTKDNIRKTHFYQKYLHYAKKAATLEMGGE